MSTPRRTLRLSLLLSLFGCGSTVATRGQCEPAWLPGGGVPGLSDSVAAVVSWDPDGSGPQPELLVVAGGFTVAGDVLAGRVAAWDGARWHPLGTGMNGPVGELVVMDGELVAGGSFTTADGVTCNRIARWTGMGWEPLGQGMNEQVAALTVYGGELIAGGWFNSADGTPARIARWDGTSWQPFGSGITAGSVWALAVHENELVVGGTLATDGGAPYPRVLRWDGSGWQQVGGAFEAGPISSIVRTLTVWNGHLIVGGSFSLAGGVACNSVARWNGAAWEALGPGLTSGWVEALHVHDGALFAGGRFGNSGTTAVRSVARWNGTAWEPLGDGIGDPDNSGNDVYHMASHAGQLVVAGGFTRAGGLPVGRIAMWSGSAWSACGSGAWNDRIRCFTYFGGHLVVGGRFTMAGGVPATCVALWDGVAWQALGNGMAGGYDTEVLALTVYNGELIAAGYFTSADGQPCNYIARWDGNTWQPLGSGVGDDWAPSVWALAVYNGDLIVGGLFTTAGGVPCNNIARWDGSTWHALDAQGMNSVVYSLLVRGDRLIAGGWFTEAGGVPCDGIAQWNGSAWQALGGGVAGGSPTGVNALVALSDGELIAGGSFTSAGGVPCNRVARWDGNTWQPLGSGIGGGFPREVYSLAVLPNGELVAGGIFTMAGGVTCNNIARWDGSVWQPLGAGLTGNAPYVFALTVSNDELIAGGSFAAADGHVSAYLARWGCPAPTVCLGDTNCDGTVNFTDIDPFVARLGCPNSNPTACNAGCNWQNADINSDGAVTFADIDPFVGTLGTSCP